jgi:amidase
MTTNDTDDLASLADELRFVSATETARRVGSGELSAVAVVSAALLRIDAANPQLNAFTRVRREEALADAGQVDRRVAAGESLPLAGVPVAAKDETAIGGEAITMGSWAKTAVCPADAEMIRRIRAAGGVIVGTTRTPELCLWPFTETDRGGATRNPWDLSRTPGGSSGGSVAAVAAGLVPMALGGDGGGSIRGPAAWAGLPALFPTVGSVPTAPLESIWRGLGVLGGFGRTVEDTALLYDVIGEPDWTLRTAIREAPAELRIAISMDRAADRPVPTGGRISPSWRAAAEWTASALRELGHDVTPASIKFGNAALKFTVRYLGNLSIESAATDDPSKLERRTKVLARLGKPLRGLVGKASDSTAERALVDRALQGYDLLLTPTMPGPPPPIGENDGQNAVRVSLRASRRVSFLSTWNHLAWPAVTIPAGLDDDGLPVAAQLIGRPGTERLLLQVAAQLEAARPWQLGHPIG